MAEGPQQQRGRSSSAFGLLLFERRGSHNPCGSLLRRSSSSIHADKPQNAGEAVRPKVGSGSARQRPKTSERWRFLARKVLFNVAEERQKMGPLTTFFSFPLDVFIVAESSYRYFLFRRCFVRDFDWRSLGNRDLDDSGHRKQEKGRFLRVSKYFRPPLFGKFLLFVRKCFFNALSVLCQYWF